jgi:hypothetical protein
MVEQIYDRLEKERGLNKTAFPNPLKGNYPINNCMNVAQEARRQAQLMINLPSPTDIPIDMIINGPPQQ